MMSDSVFECHRQLSPILGKEAESLAVLRRAEEHRNYWRPTRVRVVLLAESHVYTTVDELTRTVNQPVNTSSDIPRGFVRLVYCLGYGENHLLDNPILKPQNSGTPQYWKIFYSCVHPVISQNDFSPILVSKTPQEKRIANKFALLQRLKDMGIWLLDASLGALYCPGGTKPGTETINSCLRISWELHVSHAVKNANPKHIICIGKQVNKTLDSELRSLRIPITVLPQPAAFLTRKEQLSSFETYYRVAREAN